MSEPTPSAGIAVPRALFMAVLVAIPTMLISGTSYVVLNTRNVGDLADKVTKLETRADTLAAGDRVVKLESRIDTLAAAERVAKLEARVEAASANADMSRAAIIEMVQQGNIKLTRMEAQLGFIVGSYLPPVQPAAARR